MIVIKLEFLVEVNKKIYEISELITSVSYTDKLNDGCSKLEFSYINDSLVIENGSIVRFKYDGVNIFYGYVFKHEHSKGKEVTITAYDQLRYCKAKDTFSAVKDTVTSLTKKMCKYFMLNTGYLEDTKFVLPTTVYSDQTWIDIIYTAIGDTLMSTGRKYCLRDEFGSIAIRDIENLYLDMLLGDESLCYDFDYVKSIDDNFYNKIVIRVPGNKEKASQFVLVGDEKSISKYGLMQYYETADEKANVSQVKTMAKELLSLYNHEAETLKLKCLGVTGVRAGMLLYVKIADVKVDKPLVVKSITHDFIPIHTMDIEVAI